ncbi:hypothetical protein LCM08_20845 [Salipiger pacificus]|nr:hypothetical protein [Alloyangia pacifica]
MPRFHSTGAARADKLASMPFSALTMGDFEELHKMLRDRDLFHVDDQLARAQLADEEISTRAEAACRRSATRFTAVPTMVSPAYATRGTI